MLNNSPISLSNKRYTTVSIFTCKAEYIAWVKTTYEAVWIQGLLGKLEIFEIIIEEDYPKIVSSLTTIFANN